MSANSTDVLLVEDDARLADLTSRYLRQNGLTVEVESNGAAAVARPAAKPTAAIASPNSTATRPINKRPGERRPAGEGSGLGEL